MLSRSKLKKFVDKFIIEKIIKTHDLITREYILTAIPDVVSDKKDNYLFALCLEARADYFITGDKLLLKVNTYNHTKIIALSDFKQFFGI